MEVESGTIIVTMNEKEYTYYMQTGSITVDKPVEKIKKSTAKTDSYVGYYADIDKDGNVDGVIFVDLLTGSIRDTQKWVDDNGSYTLPTDVTISNVNNYYISKESHTWAGITKPVLSPKGNGKERFYVMQITDFTTPAYTDETTPANSYDAFASYYWYKNAYGNMDQIITSNDFGKGNENTRKMIEKWNAAGTTNGYNKSAQEKRDIWKHIQTIYNDGKGWFIPSRAEWAAFANEIGGITTDNHYDKYELDWTYWSSSQINKWTVWTPRFNAGFMVNPNTSDTYCVRLATTF